MADFSKYDKIIIWGASFPPDEIKGVATSHGYAIEKLLGLLEKDHCWEKVLCIVDSNKSLHGKKRFLGGRGEITVKEPGVILEHPDALVIINTISIKAVQKMMVSMKVKNDYMIIPYYFYHGTSGYPYQNEVAKRDAEENEQKIRELYHLDDMQTKRYMDIILELRKKGVDDLYTAEFYEGTGEGVAYFCDPQLAPKGMVTYIDVGAYNGDSIEPVRKFYCDRLDHCIAFEPDENLRVQLKIYLKEKHLAEKVVLFPYALGNKNTKVRFSSGDAMGRISEDGSVVLEQRTFDSLSGIDIMGDAMVKMDIEGAEIEALMGMRSFIKEYQPYLAICLYHRERDLYEIADYIKGLDPGYRLYLRGGWHLECWAIPQRHFK